jgi:diguanylate cyclase (GGDEF)-like protein
MKTYVPEFLRPPALESAVEITELWQRIELLLIPILGMRGFTALYNRCLEIASPQHPWLSEAHGNHLTTIDFSILKSVLSSQSNDEVIGGGKDSFEALYTQLSTLIGPELADRLLDSITMAPLSTHLSVPYINVDRSAAVSPPLPKRYTSAEVVNQGLIKLEGQILKSRWILHNLEQKILELGKSWTEKQTDLLKANENLVVATCLAQGDTAQRDKDITALTLSCAMDSLTGLPNRLLYKDRLALAISAAKRTTKKIAVLFVDLNKFKTINDTLGHNIGDLVLQHVAKALSLSVRALDTVSRHGGDEFLILLPEISKISDAIVIAQKVSKSIAIPFSVLNYPWPGCRYVDKPC